MQCRKILFLVFGAVWLQEYCEALKAGDEGVCVVKISSPKTRLRYYLVRSSKKCGKTYCTSKKAKKETYTVTSNQMVCCNGWEYESVTDVCTPQCSTGCVGGRCTAPEVCTCDFPSLPHPEHNNTCIICNATCTNANCLNNTCVCLDNYVKYNDTHCAESCETGYVLDDNLKCIPHCDSCTNGKCTGPNVCTCLEGYKQVDQYTCAPNCEPSCENATCTGINTCSCMEGFKKKDEFSCEPLCDLCDNGVCVSPGVCECRNGFVRQNDVCRPFCEKGCQNGVCTAPGECTCDAGFEKNATDPSVCFKYQEDCSVPRMKMKQIKAKSCSGKKCPPQKKTIIRWVAACCDKWEYVGKSNSCRPQCEEKCVNAFCTAPGTCTCNPSYHKHNSTHCVPDCDDGFRNNEDTFACEPICENSCINGTCTAPNTCTCFDGYEPDTPNSCKPQCHSCENGQCVEPNKCECNTGYTLQNDTCAPFCENNCTNGWCSGPNECSCDSGYEKHGNDCKPKCDLKCVNSFCSAPNVCTCEHGYEKINDICEPKCDPKCVNGFCSEPNVCSCHLGYEAEAGDAFRCRAVCTPACINSTCQSPGACSCLPGYETTADNWACKPKCSSHCKNGECVAPDECRCNEGYTFLNGECSPKCEQECLNGYCSSPDRCTCHEGFVQNETDSFKCYVPCKNCDAGTCVNGTCVCDTGFEYNDGCRLKMSVECGFCNGSCIEDVCRCANGDSCFTSRLEDPSSSPLLASFNMTWVIAGAVLIILFVTILIVIGMMAVRKNKSENMSFSDANNGSIAYTVPDTLLVRSDLPRLDENYEMDENFPEKTTDGVTNEKLLQPNTFIEKSY